MGDRPSQPTLSAFQRRAYRLLRKYRGRFLDKHEFGCRGDYGQLYRANAGGLPSKFNPATSKYDYESLSDLKLKRQVTGRDIFYGVQTSQVRTEQWTEAWSLIEIAAVLGLGNHDDLDALGQELADAPVTVSAARRHLHARPGTRTHQDLSGKLKNDDASAVTALKRALLDAEGEEYWLARRAITEFSTVDLPTRPVTELIIDIDGGHARNGLKLPCDVTLPAAQELGAAIQMDLLPPEFAVYCGVSTNGGGQHLHIQIDWETANANERNHFIQFFQAYLKKYYLDHRGYAKVDVVRGLNCSWQENLQWRLHYFQKPEYADLDEPDHLPTVGESYEASKRREGTNAILQPHLERINRTHAGDLATLPLHPLDCPDERQLDRFEAYLVGHPIPQAVLAELIGYDAAAVLPNQTKSCTSSKRSVSGASASTPAIRDDGVIPLPPSHSKAYQALRDDSLHYAARRSLLAGFAVRHNQGDREAAIEHALALVELPGGPNSGRPRHHGRTRKIEKLVDEHLQGKPGRIDPFDPAHDGDAEGDGLWIPEEQILRRMKQLRGLIPHHRLDKVNRRHGNAKYGSCLDHHLLAVALEFWCKHMVSETTYRCPKTNRIKQGRRGEVAAGQIQGALRHFGCPANRVHATASAARELLAGLQMIVVLLPHFNGKHVSHATIWAFGPNFRPMSWAKQHIARSDYAAGALQVPEEHADARRTPQAVATVQKETEGINQPQLHVYVLMGEQAIAVAEPECLKLVQNPVAEPKSSRSPLNNAPPVRAAGFTVGRES